MSVVALQLAGPLQAWGSGSRFVQRSTETAPTKSGIIGMVAAARGMRRTDPLEDLLDLRFGVRIDQPGQLVRDFHTAHRPKKDGWAAMPLSYRFYMGDAAFLAVLEGERSLLEGIDAALRQPAFPLYLGRRSCPPSAPVALGVFDHDIDGAFRQLPWLASRHERRRRRQSVVTLETVRDATSGEQADQSYRDTPVSFDPHRRRYAWRSVVRGTVDVANPDGDESAPPEHDPMLLMGG